MPTFRDVAEHIKTLPAGWDSYGAPPIDAGLVESTVQFMERVSLVPCSDGCVQLEWHTHGLDMTIDFTADGKISVYARPANDRAEIL